MKYRKIMGTYAGSNGYSRIYYYEYIPEGEPVGVIQIAHGMCEYVERYKSFIEYLLSRNMIVCGNDHLGHGRTAAPDPWDCRNLGYMGSEGWKFMVEDMHRLLTHMHHRYPKLPYYLFGHSMGSFLTRAYIAKYGEKLDGVILSGTAGSNIFLNDGIRMVQQMMKTYGSMHRSLRFNRLAYGVYNRRIEERCNEYSWLSRDVKETEKFLQDPYCNFVFTLDGFYNLFSVLKYVSTPECYKTADPHIPMLIISGDMDPVGEYGKGVREVCRRYQKEEWPDLTIKLYPGMRHEICNELGKGQVYADIFSWLEGRDFTD